MKHRWHITGMLVVALVFALAFGACDNGAQEVKVITADKPNVTIEMATGNYGVKLEWADVVGVKEFQVWRSEGELPREMLKGGIVDGNKNRFGKYVYYDIVNYLEDGKTPTLTDGGKYVYEVVGIPVVTTRDLIIDRKEFTAGTFRPAGILDMPITTISIDAERRTMTYTITPPANFLPGIGIETLDYGYMEAIMVRRSTPGGSWDWGGSNRYAGHTNPDGSTVSVEKDFADFGTGPWTWTFTTDQAPDFFLNEYGSWRGESDYGVRIGYFKFNTPNSVFEANTYYKDPNTVDTLRPFTAEFDNRKNVLTATFMGEGTGGGYVTLFDEAEVTMDDYEAEDIITKVIDKDSGRRVVALDVEIDISDVIGLVGVTYSIERATLDGGGNPGEWTDITADLKKQVAQDERATGAGRPSWVNYFEKIDLSDDPAEDNDLRVDIFGNFPVTKFYDRTLAVRKANYAYRIIGANRDWVSNWNKDTTPSKAAAQVKAALVDITIDHEVLRAGNGTFTSDHRALTGYNLNEEDVLGDGIFINQGLPNSIKYMVTPRVEKIGVLGDNDIIEIFYMRANDYQIGGYIDTQRIVFRKDDIESGAWKDFVFPTWVANNDKYEKVEDIDRELYNTYVKLSATKEFHLATPDARNGFLMLFVQAFVTRDGVRVPMGLLDRIKEDSASFASVARDDVIYQATGDAHTESGISYLNEIMDARAYDDEVTVQLRYAGEYRLNGGASPPRDEFFSGGVNGGYWRWP